MILDFIKNKGPILTPAEVLKLEKSTIKPGVLLVMDGFGLAPPSDGNAIINSKTPNIDYYKANYPVSTLIAAGESVGLPANEAGNSEVGHLTIGAGRVIYQSLPRINMAIKDGSFYENKALNDALKHAKNNNSQLHLMGLVSSGNVHSSTEHLYALLEFCRKSSFANVKLHLFTDGRDAPPTNGINVIEHIQSYLRSVKVASIATISGRYWAMDRDFRWERTAKAYFALTQGTGPCHTTPEEAITDSYNNGKTDEFVNPCTISDESGKPLALINNNDAVIFYNFRIDRPRQLAASFLLENLSPTTKFWGFDTYRVEFEDKYSKRIDITEPPNQAFKRGTKLSNIYFVMMTDYGKPLTAAGGKVAFPPEELANTLGQVISESGLRQLRVSESEKERFVTFYFNGQRESPLQGEERLIIPSPKVSTYDQKPQMSAVEMTQALLARLQDSVPYSFVLVNFANPDVVGHSGNIDATVKACEVVDECLGKLANYVTTYNGIMLITADHGNAEELINLKTNAVDTEHSDNPVPFIPVSKEFLGNSVTLPQGILADVAPTALTLLELPIPSTMTGRNLLSQIWNK